MITVIDTLAVVIGVLMASSPLLQLQRILSRRAADDVSLGMLGLLILGAATWLAYGLAHALAQVIIANAVCLSASAATLLAALRFRGGAEVARPGSTG